MSATYALPQTKQFAQIHMLRRTLLATGAQRQIAVKHSPAVSTALASRPHRTLAGARPIVTGVKQNPSAKTDSPARNACLTTKNCVTPTNLRLNIPPSIPRWVRSQVNKFVDGTTRSLAAPTKLDFVSRIPAIVPL